MTRSTVLVAAVLTLAGVQGAVRPLSQRIDVDTVHSLTLEAAQVSMSFCRHSRVLGER